MPYQFSRPVPAKKSAVHNWPSDARIRMEQHTEAAHSAKRRFPQNQRPANAPFPLAYKQKTPDNAQAHSVPRHAPVRRAPSPSSRHRKALPVPAFPRSISQNAKSAEQESNSGIPPSSVNPIRRTNHAHANARRTMRKPTASLAMPPPRPARSFAYCAIIALPCGAFRASSAARR